MDANHPTRTRLEDQRRWMSAKAAACQKAHKRLRIAQLVCAAAIPFVTGWQLDEPHVVGSMPLSALLSGLLALAVVFLIALQETGKYQENWLNYRRAAETLKSELHLHTVTAGPYGDSQDPDRLLAERVEEILQQENRAWVAHSSKQGS